MNLFSEIEDLGKLTKPLHLAIGVFDGVHLGHQKVIQDSISESEAVGGDVVVVTFDPHPVSILSPQNAPRLLTSIQHKARVLNQELGVQHLLAIRFDREFSELTGDAFIRQLHASAAIGSISVGEDFHFGKDRSGNVALLRHLATELEFKVFASELVKVNELVASSTQVREAIASGDLKIANALLGRNYTVLGPVIKGRQMGRTLGFPTANLTVHSEQLPPTGVYAVRAFCCEGKSWNGVANLGYRPTVENGDVKRLLEVHLFDFSGDIYGEELTVEFVSFIRPEKKFDGLEALKEQIQKDSTQARQILAS